MLIMLNLNQNTIMEEVYITNKRDFNGFTLDVREVTNLSHEEAFDLFENVLKKDRPCLMI